MPYMTWLPMLDPRSRNIKLSGEVYYGENAVIDIPAASVDDRFKEITAGLIGRVTSRIPPGRRPASPSAASVASAASTAAKGEIEVFNGRAITQLSDRLVCDNAVLRNLLDPLAGIPEV